MKAILVILTILTIQLSYSQTFTAEYERIKPPLDSIEQAKVDKRNDFIAKGFSEKDKKALVAFKNQPVYFTLTHSNGLSEFTRKKDKKKEIKMSAGEGATFTSIKIIRGGSVPEIWHKNFNSQKIISQQNIMNKQFIIKEEISDLNWTVTEETKIIGDFNCIKATLKTEDKTLTAYYSEEIPISDGPFLYYGLPGLIIELDDESYLYTLNSLTITDAATAFVAPTKGKEIEREEFDKTKKEKFKNGAVTTISSQSF